MGARGPVDLGSIRPMDAVTILYSHGEEELTEAIVASLSHGVFEGTHGGPAGPGQRAFARFSYRVLKLTTTRRKSVGEGYEGGAFHNPIMVWSKHPYARALLDSSRKETENLVEGGDPMNGPYMMISREILGGSDVWDRIFLHSVQGKDVQLRFIAETQATYAAARLLLEQIAAAHPDYYPQDVAILKARAADAAGDPETALHELAAMLDRSVGLEARFRYGEILARIGKTQEARSELKNVVTHARKFRIGPTERPWARRSRQLLASLG